MTTTRWTTRWTGVVLGGLLATVGACAHEGGERRQSQAAAQPPAKTAEARADTEAQRAASQAAQADQALAQARQRLDAANRDAVAADQQRAQTRQQLAAADQRATQAQQRIAQEQANVQRLDASAQTQHAAADRAAEQAQLAAEQAQGLRVASGRVIESSASRVTVATPDGGTTSFRIDPGTRVLVGPEQRSVAELQRGADARVAYDASGGDLAAVVIHVTPARQPSPPPASGVAPR